MGVLEVKDRVQRMLTGLVGTVEIDQDGDFTFPYDSTRVFVSVEEWVDGLSLVSVISIPIWEAPPSSELFQYVARKSFRFGALTLYERDDGTLNVNFRHQLIGDTLDPEEFEHAVRAVAMTANEVDDEIKDTFGGKRWADLG